MQVINKYIKGDRVIWAVALLLAIFSVLVVYSSIVTLAYKYQNGNTEYYLFKHSIILFIGFLLMYFAHKVNYRYFSRISQIGLLLAIPLLLFTLLYTAIIDRQAFIRGIGADFKPVIQRRVVGLEGNGFSGIFAAPEVPDSDVPGLYGKKTLVANRAVSDLVTNRLYHMGPGD